MAGRWTKPSAGRPRRPTAVVVGCLADARAAVAAAVTVAAATAAAGVAAVVSLSTPSCIDSAPRAIRYLRRFV